MDAASTMGAVGSIKRRVSATIATTIVGPAITARAHPRCSRLRRSSPLWS
jgi:hypothetical protein